MSQRNRRAVNNDEYTAVDIVNESANTTNKISTIVNSLITMQNIEIAFTKWFIEFGGALIIVFAVGLSINESDSIPTIASVFGAVIAILTITFRQQHFNPFFTLQAYFIDLITKGNTKIQILTGLAHVLWLWGIQLAGSTCGALALEWAFNSKDKVGATLPIGDTNMGEIIFYEFVGAFFYGITYFSLSSRNLNSVPSPTSGKNIVLI